MSHPRTNSVPHRRAPAPPIWRMNIHRDETPPIQEFNTQAMPTPTAADTITDTSDCQNARRTLCAGCRSGGGEPSFARSSFSRSSSGSSLSGASTPSMHRRTIRMRLIFVGRVSATFVQSSGCRGQARLSLPLSGGRVRQRSHRQTSQVVVQQRHQCNTFDPGA